MSDSHQGQSASNHDAPFTDPYILQLIDDACDRFEEEWKSEPQPRIENVLARVEPHIRPALFAALLPVEIELRREAGEMPDATSYRKRFPDFDAIISKEFHRRDDKSRTLDRPASRPPQREPFSLKTKRSEPSLGASASDSSSNTGSKPTWPVGRVCESVAEFQQALLASGIVNEKQLANFLRSNPAAAKSSDISQFATALKKAGLVTKYQAENIYAGRGAALVMGNHVILDKLGQGGMGMVMKARHRRMQREVALKLLPREAMKSTDAVKRFLREVQAAAQLSHPNIVAAYDADEAHGMHFLAMELVEGPDLSAVIKERGPQPVEVAIDWISQAAKGLAYAHARGIVHRDIKPANLLLDANGTIKVLDMGLARIERDVEGNSHAQSLSSMTNTGQIMGTIDFMAPEQALDTHMADARADIYSLGCTLFRVISGANLFEAGSVMAKLLAHREKPIPSLTEACRQANAKSSLSPESVNAVLAQLESVFQRMVAKRPEDRFQTMNEVVAALEDCMRQSGRVADIARVAGIGASSQNP